MVDPDKNDPESRLALVLFRSSLLLEKGDFARAADIAPGQYGFYERGERPTPRNVLEKAAIAAGFPLYLLDLLLWVIRSFRAVVRGKSRADRAFAEGFFVELVALVRQAVDLILEPVRAARPAGIALPASEDRLAAAALWAHLETCTAAERRMLVEELAEYRTWALCERVARESIHAAPNHPKEALELAELALLIAELVPGEALFCSRLKSYAWAHVGNGRHVCNDLPGADEALARARKLWEAGAGEDSGLLNEAWLPWIEASLRRSQRRFTEALKRIKEALDLDQKGELKGEILLTKARIHETLGDPVASVAALIEATPLIDPSRQPRSAFGLRFNLLAALCSLERFEEAEQKLSEVRELAERLGGELDLARLVWLEGQVAAGLGRTAAAETAFQQARQVFERRELTVNYALVSLELALVLLEQGRTAEVRILAEEMLTIFRAQQVEREALAALRLFCDAAKQETATVELTRRVVKFLERAQHDPELRFEREGG
ncbi:MAG TPA: tetratricopeptide repeat protein [Thermoanaerobaculia bacterium]|nr:tetratricopeptide repeat protein [Thermoanaerobaculia bacterium]